MTILGKLSEPTTETIPIYWPGETGRGSMRAPFGLRAKIDDLMQVIYETTGAKFSRNEFIIKAVRFYLAHLMRSKNKVELIKKIEEVTENT